MVRRAAATLFFLGWISSPFAQIADSSYTLVPKTTLAGQTFNLTLKNRAFTCATRFSNQSVSHSGVALDLVFEAVNDTTVHCPSNDTLYGPTFSVSALTTGFDSVYADQKPACAPICQIIAIPRVFAGILTVKSPGSDSTWFIHPRQVTPNTSFTLQLLNYAYGQCQTSFSHDSLNISNGSIDAYFVVVSHPDTQCSSDTVPFGPSYPVSGLNIGKYPVYAVQRYACEYTPPYCPPALIFQLVDTLTVTSSSGILSQSRARGSELTDAYTTDRGYLINGKRFNRLFPTDRINPEVLILKNP